MPERGKSRKPPRDKIIPIRATNAEVQEIDDIAESQGLNRSQWVRQQLKAKIEVVEENPQITDLIKTLQQITTELAPIGNNLNQLTRQVNTAVASGQNLPQYVDNPESINHLNNQVQSIKQTIQGLILEVKPRTIYKTTKKK